MGNNSEVLEFKDDGSKFDQFAHNE